MHEVREMRGKERREPMDHYFLVVIVEREREREREREGPMGWGQGSKITTVFGLIMVI